MHRASLFFSEMCITPLTGLDFDLYFLQNSSSVLCKTYKNAVGIDLSYHSLKF